MIIKTNKDPKLVPISINLASIDFIGKENTNQCHEKGDSCQYGTMLGPHGMMNVTFCPTDPCITSSLRKTEWLMYMVLVPCKGMF